MSEITTHERPGVYSSYEASSLTAASAGGGAVAVVANGGDAAGSGVYTWTSYSRAAADVGQCALSELARLALKNGAGVVYGVAAGEDYAAAFEQVAALEGVAVVVCDSTTLTVQQALRDMVEECAQVRKERVAVVAGAAGETVSALVQRAAGLNHERVVLVAPGTVDSEGQAADGACCAAAVAGAIAGSTDPALPLGGAELKGLDGLSQTYDDGEIDLLVRGGVTPLETVSGSTCVVRAVTTRTTTGGAADASWRELTTILVVDEVIPAIRDSLRARFRRVKNTEQTRGAIRSQVVLELEDRVSREIIDGYEDVTVSADESDPTVCLVEFAFAVTHGLNQIWLSAHITV